MDAHPHGPIEAFWGPYAEAGRPGPRYALRHPVALLRAVRAAQRLPLVPADPSPTPDGRAVREALQARTLLGLPGRLLGTAALSIPVRPEDYLDGRPARTLRRKVRAAQRAGITVEGVRDADERSRLVVLADEQERRHPDPTYRVSRPDNGDLLDLDLWLVARDREGTPLLLSVTPVDGDLAALRYFRTLGRSPAHSNARYLLTAELVRQLAARRVRWLLDTESISAQTSGLRHFQRMIGFEYIRCRLHLGRSERAWHGVHIATG